MFQLMANTGKLVKISELDMGYVDKSGNTVPTTKITDSQHRAMAGFYEFIVRKYLEIVPPAQQYGITQWCMQDAPGALGTGWRGGEPVGLWDQNDKLYKRDKRRCLMNSDPYGKQTDGMPKQYIVDVSEKAKY